MTTPGHGPLPSGVCRVTGQVPSAVVTVAEMLGMVPFYSSARHSKLTGVPIATPYEDLLRLVMEQRDAEVRSHRHGHPQPVRPPVALRPVRRLPADHHQEGAPQVGRLRAAVVPARRLQRRLAAGARRHHLGRMGFGHRRSRADLRRAVAIVADAVGRAHRPDQRGAGTAAHRPRLAADHRVGVERRARSRRWRWRRATRSSSSTSPTAG